MRPKMKYQEQTTRSVRSQNLYLHRRLQLNWLALAGFKLQNSSNSHLEWRHRIAITKLEKTIDLEKMKKRHTE